MHNKICEREGWCWIYNLVLWGWLPLLIVGIKLYGQIRKYYLRWWWKHASNQDKAFYALNEHIEQIEPVGEAKIGSRYVTVVNLEKHGGAGDKP